jgi:hypothetical protein
MGIRRSRLGIAIDLTSVTRTLARNPRNGRIYVKIVIENLDDRVDNRYPIFRRKLPISKFRLMPQLWFEPLIWMDFRLAVIFTVLMPLILLIWAFAQKTSVLQTLLIIYWRVASLLAITVYLGIGSLPITFLASFVGQSLIPLSLWFWADLNEEIADLPDRPLKLGFLAWRWATTVYSTLSAIALIPFLSCAFGSAKTDYCQAWFKPSWLYYQFFHPNSKPEFLSLLGVLALIIYALCLGYFLIVRLGKQGRSAMAGDE